MIYYLPLERLDKRYTNSMHDLLVKGFTKWFPNNVTVIEGKDLGGEIKVGSFLDSDGTNYWKFAQLQEVCKLFRNDEIKDGDIFFISDLWFPGLESIKYMAMFHNITVKIVGMFHAGSWTETDYVRELEPWAANLERGWFDMIDEVYLGSEFIKSEIIEKTRAKYFRRLKVTGLPFDFDYVKSFSSLVKEDLVVFTGRLCDEKQPWQFDNLKINGTKVKTMEMGLSKIDYYKLLGRAKVIFSSALQENFGYGPIEGITLGCMPVMPNRLAYKEQYPTRFRYQTLKKAEDMINDFLKNYKDVSYLTENHKNNVDNIMKEILKFV